MAAIMWFISNRRQLWGGVNLLASSDIDEASIRLKLRSVKLFSQATSWKRSIAKVQQSSRTLIAHARTTVGESRLADGIRGCISRDRRSTCIFESIPQISVRRSSIGVPLVSIRDTPFTRVEVTHGAAGILRGRESLTVQISVKDSRPELPQFGYLYRGSVRSAFIHRIA